MSKRAVAVRFRVPRSTVLFWVRRAADRPLEQVAFSDRSSAPLRQAGQTAAAVEARVVEVRRSLAAGDLGFAGAALIREQLVEVLPAGEVPGVRTVGRILKRSGLLDGRRRVRRPPPPPGWYLPQVAGGLADLDAVDVVEDLLIEDGPLVSVLCARSMHAPWRGAWPAASVRVAFILEQLQRFWMKNGLPHFVQFDNDTRFQGSHCTPDVFGRVIRVCLRLGVTPVFAPPAEHGPQNLIESFNHLWLQKVWHRFHHPGLEELVACSERFTAACQQHLARRHDPLSTPPRRTFPAGWKVDWKASLCGRVFYLRRTDEQGNIRLLGHHWTIDPAWPNRLVRAEVDFDAGHISFFGLRRADHHTQPCLKIEPYFPPARIFSAGDGER